MDFSKLNVSNEPPVYKGRVIQADADFYCYFVAKLDENLTSNVNHLLNILETNRKMLGAVHLNAHITLGSKGGRFEMATIKPYQDNRKNGAEEETEVKTRVKEIRAELANWAGNDVCTVVANVTTEADDSISQYHTAYNASGKGVSIIDSGDKDLNMCQGVHRDADTQRLINVSGYGVTKYHEVGNVKPKLKGYGDSWFWHQMLMGDLATDNIPGLEVLHVDLLNEYLPTKKFNPKRKNAACGAAKAVAILKDVSDSKTAGWRVLEAYKAFYGGRASERMIEQAFLLWMRRDGNVWDCIHFMNEHGLKMVPTLDQRARVNKWAELMVAVHGVGCVKVEL